MDNIELDITEEAVRAVAKKAKELKTGARGLRAIIEEAMQDVMFSAPSKQNIEKIVITEKVISGEEKPLLIYKEKEEKAG